jgi:hypothetical protein
VDFNGFGAINQTIFFTSYFFGTFTTSGVNHGAHVACVHGAAVSLNQHPSLPSIFNAVGGSSGDMTLTTTVSDFARRCSVFAKNFWMEPVTVDGPSSYLDTTVSSLPSGGATLLNGGNLVWIDKGANRTLSNLQGPTSVNESLVPDIDSSRYLGDFGKQWLFTFNYILTSTGTDLYIITTPSSFGASPGHAIYIQPDSYGLAPSANGGNVEVETVPATGTGNSGSIVLKTGAVDLGATRGDLRIDVNETDLTLVGPLNVNTAPGTAGDVLTSQGAALPPIWAPASGGIPITTSQYVVAVPGDDLATKYAAAVALQGGTPSATSRSTLIIFPGTYTLSALLNINAEYVDVIGLGAQPQRPAVRVEGGSVSVTANDVRVEGIGTALSLYVGDNLPSQVFTSCKGEGPDSFGGSNNVTGTFIDCVGLDTSFAGFVASAGTFIRCSGGYASFGFDATGYFEDCSSAGQYAFGGGALASGTFLRCTSSGVDTFGGGAGGTASGTFTSCAATGANSFGASGYASGTFTNCQGLGAGSFGGGIGGGSLARGCSGVFNGCIGGLNSFGNSGAGEISGQLYSCRTLYGLFGNGEITTILEYQTVTVTPGAPAIFTTATAHGYSVNDPIRLTTTGTPPTGMLANQTYFVASAGLTATDFTLVTFPESIGIPPTVDTTDAGTGTQTVTSGRLVNCIDGYNDAVTI